MSETNEALPHEFIEEATLLWGALRGGIDEGASRWLDPAFETSGYPVEGGPGDLDALAAYFGAGAGLTNLVHVVTGAQRLDDLGLVSFRWIAERGLGDAGSPSYVSGRATVSLRRGQDGWRVRGWLGAPGPHEAETATSRASDAEAIREQILRVFEAYRQGDLATLRRTHTRDWRGFSLSSSGVGRGIDAYMKGAQGAIASMQFQEYRILEFEAVFYGDLAIVPYVARIAGLDRMGRAEAYRLRVLDVYLREPLGWNQVATNVGLHPEEMRGSS